VAASAEAALKPRVNGWPGHLSLAAEETTAPGDPWPGDLAAAIRGQAARRPGDGGPGRVPSPAPYW